MFHPYAPDLYWVVDGRANGKFVPVRSEIKPAQGVAPGGDARKGARGGNKAAPASVPATRGGWELARDSSRRIL
jgi:hypothetical protein